MGSCCDDSFFSVSRWAGIATMRAVQAKSIPEDMQYEDLDREFSCEGDAIHSSLYYRTYLACPLSLHYFGRAYAIQRSDVNVHNATPVVGNPRRKEQPGQLPRTIDPDAQFDSTSHI